MGLILLYLTIALSISFLCSILEAVLLSTPSSFINMKEAENPGQVKLLKSQKNNIDRPISAILSLNTIAHTIGAAGVGAEAVKYFGEAYFGVISAVLTVMILVFSEIIPKTIGASYWRSLAIPSAKIIQVMIVISFPLVWLSEFITRLLANRKDQATVSREEVSAMVDTGEKEGVFHSKENRIIQNLIKLGNLKVSDIMTPRIVTQIAEADQSLKDFYDNQDYKPYSRIPLYQSDREYITGYVLLKDVLENLADDNFETKVETVKREIITIYERESVSSVWEKMLEHKEHIAAVVNEYGAFEGIVTMEDIVETILGLEIIDERDMVVDMQQLAREKWQARLAKYQNFESGSGATVE